MSNTDYCAIAAKVEEEFKTPTYLEQRILYVNSKEDADVTISPNCNLGDYLLVGLVSLQRSIHNSSGMIRVFKDAASPTEVIGFSPNSMSPFLPVNVNSGLYLQVVEVIEEIYQSTYDGEYKMFGLGLGVSIAMLTQFSSANSGIPDDILSELYLEEFEDLKAAQENAFTLIKKMAGS